MLYRFLTRKFFDDYKDCAEIEKKSDRPYAVFVVCYNGYNFAIPFRSHIKHKFAFFTDPQNGCGLDYSKAVIVLKAEYLDDTVRPEIRQNEHEALLGKDFFIIQELKTYINIYKKAYANISKPRNKLICQYSCLQYFHKELELE